MDWIALETSFPSLLSCFVLFCLARDHLPGTQFLNVLSSVPWWMELFIRDNRLALVIFFLDLLGVSNRCGRNCLRVWTQPAKHLLCEPRGLF